MDEKNLVELIGTVKRVVFTNDENGYTVLALDVGGKEPLTVVGCIPFAAPGEGLEVQGTWERHNSYGEQLKVVSARRTLPVGESHIYDYLASGIVKGIGPTTASLLVTHFGSRTLDVLSSHPEELAQIKGISMQKARRMSDTFRSQTGMRLLMEFLVSNELRPEYAMRLYKAYGDSAMELLESNPYIISSDRIGGHFEEADRLALSLGFESDSPQRIAAALIYEMKYNLNNGHTFLPRPKLVAATAALIGVEEENADECLDMLLDEGEVVSQTIAGLDAMYLRRLYEAETFSAVQLLQMGSAIQEPTVDTGRIIDRLERESGMHYAPNQRMAIELAATHRLLAITGGPGTGKTTILRAILRLYDEMELECLLAAPTGRAAKRMTELTGQDAYTIHRLLGASWSAEGDELSFRKNEDDPLKCQAVILDECSMVDITLISALLRALPKGCRLVLVGDADQLPSVGPGSFFHDVLRSGTVAAVRLSEVFRQSEESHIIRNAHMINHGQLPDLRENKVDFFFLGRPSGERTSATITELCRDRLPRNMGFLPSEIQVLSPTRVGETGTVNLNRLLQDALNPADERKKEKKFGEIVFREGDKIMQIRNNYDIVWCRGIDFDAVIRGEVSFGAARESGCGIFNGDMGQIRCIDPENQLLWVEFDDRLAFYGYEQLGELEHAFAVTVHKSQGSEYKAVILAAGKAPERLLSRDLLYTAVTRARSMLIIVGDDQVIGAMVGNARKSKRYSGLRARLAGEVE